MLPHSISKNTINMDRPRTFCMDSETTDYEGNKIDDYFRSDNDVILEGEEEYDVLNDETFGDAVTDLPVDRKDELVSLQPWDECDLHNDETFGGEISYDWEAEHEKMVDILEPKVEDETKKSAAVNKLATEKLDYSLNAENSNQNGYHRIEGQLHHRDLEGDRLETVSRNRPAPSGNVHLAVNEHDAADDFGSTETLTNENCNKMLKQDKWYNHNLENNYYDSNSEYNTVAFSQGYSLFSSGTNLLQNAGIHIPPVSNTSSLGINTVENIEKRLGAMKLQQNSSSSSIPSVSDLEKQLITDASPKSVITADCFRAYNSAFFVNSNSTSNSTNVSSQNFSSALAPQQKPPVDPFNNRDTFRNDSVGVHFQGYPMNGGDANSQSFFGNMNLTNRLPQFDPKSFPVPVMTDSGIIMCDNTLFRNVPNFAEVNPAVSSFVNNNVLNRTKGLAALDPSVIASANTSNRIIDGSLLIDNSITNSNMPRLGMNVFPPPPPGLTIDPSKLRHIQNTAVLQSRQQQSTPCLALQPLQVLNGIDPAEQQKKITKLQKEDSLSNMDEYAGMMTEREKYWLAGVQLLQINGMDPYKDDYYFTNYQARRKGNRNKSQNNNNNNNNNWKKEHKDYSPLQFENSLGKVQVGSVVAPRKVIDTDVFDSSPKHNGKLNESAQDDPIANTSNRKRKAIMLHIENMYGKIMALESLQVNSSKNKSDPATIMSEFESIVTGLREEILNLKDDFKIIMSIKKGKRLVLRFLSFCENLDDVWFQIFEILDRIMRGDQEHCILLCYLPYFRSWLTTVDLNTLNRIADYFKQNMAFFLRDKFSVSAIANMIEHAEITFFYSKPEDQNGWMEFILTLAENVHTLDDIQKPVVSVKSQVLRSHLLKCKTLENGYMSNLLKIFSNNSRK